MSGPLYFLAVRDIASNSLAATAAELYCLKDMPPDFNWSRKQLDGSQRVDWSAVPQIFRNRRVCFLVHGFNVSHPHGVESLGPAAQALSGLSALAVRMAAADLVIPVLWPGDGLIGWSWFNAFHTAKASAGRISEFLAGAAKDAAQVSFVSHSLGARVVLHAVGMTLNRKSDFPFDTAVLTAAAVSDDSLDTEFKGATTGLRRIVVLSSWTDEVLRDLFTVGNLFERALWWNYHGDNLALGRGGPKFKPGSPNIGKTEWYEVRSDSANKQNHGDYFPDADSAGVYPAGWSNRRTDVARFCEDIFDVHPFKPALADWGIDHTGQFRPGWPPQF